ncbi:hypothetical protein L6164_007014 [Bauhinia variegata]|uniref:Uncharacterized protein n=1 Tax=Bauhinia variegata TaxID=167791 RepID=A0ACB9PVL2_BAUVA|nr:hypothetical protein L6164_007014 [Bauhinia variegata]
MTVATDSSPECFSKAKAWLPGFRFHPTDEELVLYYLKKKMCRRKLRVNIIAETDVYKWDPEELPGQSILKTGDRQWFFFSPRDRKYPNGARSNRATRHGYWKATGKDRNVTCNSRTVGLKKTLVFHKGRAPNGERTDWVMHEYTLDEEELKRCQGVQDYYALYKVYKKSGLGPKNGEQYGAPFKEEEWADDDFVECNITSTDEEDLTRQPDAVVTSLDTVTVNANKEIMRKILYDDPVPDQLQVPGCPPALSQVFAGETQTAVVDQFCLEPITTFDPSTDQCHLQPSYDFTQSAISQVHVSESPEVTSTPQNQEKLPLLNEEDFLEIDDLLGPELAFSNMDKPLDNLQFEDGLSEFDLFHDAAMFFQEMGPIDQENSFPHPHMNTLGGNLVNQDFQLLPYPEGVTEAASELWMHDQGRDVVCPSEQSDVSFSLPTSGVPYDSAIVPARGNQNSTVEDGATSIFSSALWSFVESVPTSPASACEGALVNRAFERMASFSRLRINAKCSNAVAGIHNSDSGKHKVGR